MSENDAKKILYFSSNSLTNISLHSIKIGII